MNILVAEDHQLCRETVRFLMHTWGYDLDIALNGQEAIEKAGERQYDLCLMDIDMPVMDGYQATRIIRRQLRYLPIIAVTANPALEKKRCLEAGMDDFLGKPFDHKDLQQKIIEWTVKAIKIQRKDNSIEIRKEMPVDSKHAKELRELAKENLCKINLRGIGAHDVAVITHKNVPYKISEDFIGNEDQISIFLDRSKEKPAECHLYKSSCPMPTIYLSEEECEEKAKAEDKILKNCTTIIKKKKEATS